jgi:hypothetical protein
MFKRIFDRTAGLYLLAVIVALAIGNPRAAMIQRMNILDAGRVPVNVLSGKKDPVAKDISCARKYYDLMSRVFPQSFRGSEMRGVCYVLLNKDPLAVRSFRQALQINPGAFWVSYDLGMAYYRQRRYPQALEAFRKVAAQSTDGLWKSAVLSPLNKLPSQQRSQMFALLPAFVMEAKSKSYLMAVSCLVRMGKTKEAQETAAAAVNDQGVEGKQLFQAIALALAADRLEAGLSSDLWKDVDPGRVMLHPWAHFIEPGKERFFD